MFLLHLKLPSLNLHFSLCFCYWTNSFMKRDEGGIFSKFPDQKPLLLFEIKVKQNPRCPSKEYKGIFKHFHQNIRAYHRSKKICIDQWLVKWCILGRIWAKRGVSEWVWFVPNTGVGSEGSRDTLKFFRFWN